MKPFGVIAFFALLSSSQAKSLPDAASVVSVYTTQPSPSLGSSGLDIYQQIATNIAERISTPIYRFFGFEKNQVGETEKPQKPWDNLELLEDPYDDASDDTTERDIEELSNIISFRDQSKKPEKVTLYNAYLPVNGKVLVNIDDMHTEPSTTTTTGIETTTNTVATNATKTTVASKLTTRTVPGITENNDAKSITEANNQVHLVSASSEELGNSFTVSNDDLFQKPARGKLNEVEFDGDKTRIVEGRGEGVFVYVLEWIGQVVQIAWGAFSSIFKS